MTPNNNLSVLPFYTSLEQQNARKWWVYGRIYPLFTPAGYVLPFQILVPHLETPNISSICLFDANTDVQIGADMLNDFSAAGLDIKQFPDKEIDVVVFPSNNASLGPISNGRYYLRAIINGVYYYSEIFTVVNDIQPYLKIRWWDLADFVMDAGIIVYTEPLFKNILYIKSDIAKPQYNFEEEGENRDGYFFPTKQLSEKRYRFNFLASEYLLDVMRFIRMSDNIEIEYHGQTYKPDTFLITPEWENEGDVAVVEAEFDTDTVAKKLPYMELLPPVPTNFLNVNPSSIVFLATGQALTINISSNVAWAINVPGWVTASTLSGENNGTVTLTASENTTGAPRTGTVTVSGVGVPSANVAVSQPIPSAKYLSVEPSSISFLPAGQSVTLNVVANVPWSFTFPAWITPSQTSGQTNATITLTASANSTGSARSGILAFTGTDVPAVNVAISQSAVITPEISISPTEMNIDYKARTFYFQIVCTGRWECSGSTAPGWLNSSSTGTGNGTATLTILANNTGSPRTGTLTFRMVDYPNVTCTATINQAQYVPTYTYALEFGSAGNSHTFPASGGTFTPVIYGITYTDGTESGRVTLSASDLTITKTGSNAISRNNLTFSAANLGTTQTTEQTANFALVWNAHNTATANITCKQQANVSSVYQSSTYTPEQSILYWAVGGSGNASPTGDNARLDSDITKVTTIITTWTSGSQETDTETEIVQGTWSVTGTGLSIDATQTLWWWDTNENPTPRTGTLTLIYQGRTINTWNLTQDAAQVNPTQITITYKMSPSDPSSLTITSTARYLYENYVGWWTSIGMRYTALYPVVGSTVYSDSALTQTFGIVTAVQY